MNNMPKLKILNLYCGIGGNRSLWGNNHQITAVEYNPLLAKIYQDLYPNDTVIVDDAHEYLRLHYKEFDYIWSSPPCQSHSSFRHNICVRFRGTQPVFPDMNLYSEIIFLQYHAKCFWSVENVKPYYPVLIKGKQIDRHLFWSNFPIEDIELEKANMRKAQIPQLSEYHGINLSKYKIPNKRQILRNCVSGELGKHVLDQAIKHLGEQNV